MKLSCIPVSFFPELISGELSIAQWARLGAELGLDAIDVSVLFLKSRRKSYLRSIAKEIGKSGLQIAIVNTYPDLTHPNASARKKENRDFLADIEAAAELEADMVRITAGQAYPALVTEEAVKWVLDSFHRAAVHADTLGIKLVYENHSKPGVWKYPDFSYRTERFLKIAEGISDTSIRILYDTANANTCGVDPLLLLENVIRRVACVHAADTSTADELNPVIIGTGIVPFKNIFRRLQEVKFDGVISIEEASHSGMTGMRQAIQFIKKIWLENK